MALTTNIKVVRASGLGTYVTNENIGTGDGSANNYSLDNVNVIEDSYDINFGLATDNSRSSLTIDTDYTIDIKTGDIQLTATGLSRTNTFVIYGKYVYIDDEPDNDNITEARQKAEEEVKRLTGQLWESETLTEYHDGKPLSRYPTTNFPFDYDYPRRKFIQLDKYPVQYVNYVWFLNRGDGWDKVFNYDSDITTYTDITDDINSPEEDDVTLFATTSGIGDIVYFGNSQKFLNVQHVLKTVGTGSPAITWEYYNGSSWTALTVTASVTGSDTFEASGKVSWDNPANWTKVAVNGSNEYYWVRARLTAAFTISPVAEQAAPDQNGVIERSLALSEFDVDEQGKLTFINTSVPEGVRNVKIEYVAGETDTNRKKLAEELNSLLGGLRIFITLTGGSYDDATSYRVGSKTVTIGEQYVNIREVLNQFRTRIDGLMKQIGQRIEIGAW